MAAAVFDDVHKLVAEEEMLLVGQEYIQPEVVVIYYVFLNQLSRKVGVE